MEWISVKDKLPELEQLVLAVLNEPNKRFNYPYEENVLILYRRRIPYATGYEIEWERPFGGETIDYNNKVIYWMPIPQLPSNK